MVSDDLTNLQYEQQCEAAVPHFHSHPLPLVGMRACVRLMLSTTLPSAIQLFKQGLCT